MHNKKEKVVGSIIWSIASWYRGTTNDKEIVALSQNNTSTSQSDGIFFKCCSKHWKQATMT